MLLFQESAAALRRFFAGGHQLPEPQPFTYGELAADPQDHAKLTEIIDSFGPMPCRILPLTTERMAKMIEDAIVGRTD